VPGDAPNAMKDAPVEFDAGSGDIEHARDELDAA
jgi:hypothetical protein